MTQWADKEDCEVVIDESSREPRLKLIDADGDTLFEAPPSWGEDDLWYALQIANKAYQLGHCDGSAERAREIQKALGLTNLWQMIEGAERDIESHDRVIRVLNDSVRRMGGDGA